MASVRSLARRVLPAGVVEAIRARRAPAASQSREAELGTRITELEQRLDHERLYPMEWVHRRVRDLLGLKVRKGPFQGMEFPDWGITGIDAFSARILGCYEQELHGAVERLIALNPPVVMNIGSAEGYYAIGLARRLPVAKVHACDTVTLRIQRLRTVADINGVEVDAIDQPADHAMMREQLVPGALVVIDCDGPEDELLDPEAVPVLRECAVLVETHDMFKPGITERITAAFEGSHDIERVTSEPRWPQDFPEIAELPYVTRAMAIQEFRDGPQDWLVMTPRS